MNDPRRSLDPLAAGARRIDPDATAARGSTSAWDSLATSLGGLARVLLRDTDADGQGHPEPPSRPGSAEMPARGAGPARLHLLGEIARGGMGAVLKGRDPALCRDLAVKVLLEKHRDDPDLTRRFVEEAQIAGQLQHPGIVPVYRLGTMPDRRPYFTMTLVKGRTLAALLEARDRPESAPGTIPSRDREGAVGGATPSPPLPHGRGSARDDRRPQYDDLPRFLSIFEQVCRTMSYAHARGVIHRDLKPSNIMVGGFGEVQVMDWGLAKVLARGEPTRPPDDPSSPSETVVATARSGQAGSDPSRAGSVIGTPAYMAPEQARGEVHRVDARADVFALGAILCEILTGRPPYAGRNPAEVQRKAARGDLAEALAAIDASGADPELIAFARDCLTAEPDDRPADARAVADRIGGYLAGVGERLRQAELDRAAEAARAEEAEAAAVVERRARRLTVGLAAAVLVLIGLAGGGYAWLESDRAVRRAATERGVVAELDRARQLEAEALAAPADRLGPWESALAAARGALARLDQGEPHADLRGRIERAIDEIERGQRAAQERADRIATDRTLLAELESIRGVRADHADWKRADAEYAAAFRKAGLDPDAADPHLAGAQIAVRTAPVELASFLDDWAYVRGQTGADPQAVGRLVAAARAADKHPWRDALRAGFGMRGPEAIAALSKLAGDDKALSGQPAESLQLLARLQRASGDRDATAQILRRAWRLRPDDFWVNFELADAEGAVHHGSSEESASRRAETIRYLTAALAIRPDSVSAHNNLGLAWHAHGKLDEAADEYRAAIRCQPGHAVPHNNLGALMAAQGKVDEAIAEHRAAIRLQPDFAAAHYNLGLALGSRGTFDEAIAEYRTAIWFQPDYAEAHFVLGNALLARGKRDEAADEYRAAIRFRPDDAEAHGNLGHVLYEQGKWDEAIAEYRTTLRIQPDDAKAHVLLGMALGDRGKLDEAVIEFRAATHLQPNNAEAHANLGTALEAQGKLDEAIAEFREATRIRPDDAKVHVLLGNALGRRGRVDEAVVEYRAATGIQPDDAVARGNLGIALEARGKLDEALAELRMAWQRAGPDAEARLPGIRQRIAVLERRIHLLARLPRLLEGRDRPANAAEDIEFAVLCRDQDRPAASARLYAEALKADPKVGDARNPPHRSDAARAAAMAGCGRGKDDPPPDPAERAELRKLALGWLRDDLAAWGRLLDAGDQKMTASIASTLLHWKGDSDLAGVRDPDALSQLSEAERKPWQALWTDVDRLLRRAGGPHP